MEAESPETESDKLYEMQSAHRYLEAHGHTTPYPFEPSADEKEDASVVVKQIIDCIRSNTVLKEELLVMHHIAAIKREHASELEVAEGKVSELQLLLKKGPKMVPQHAITLFESQLENMAADSPEAEAHRDKLSEMQRKNRRITEAE